MSKDRKRVAWSEEQVVDFLGNLRTASPASLVLRTYPTMNKFNREERDAQGNVVVQKMPNPYLDRVYKITYNTVMLGASYEKSVNRELARQGEEPDFKAQELPFGTWFNKNTVIHNGRFYLRYHFLRRKLAIVKTEYRMIEDDSIVDVHELEPYFPPKKDTGVIVNCTKLENVVSMVCNKMDIVLVRNNRGF